MSSHKRIKGKALQKANGCTTLGDVPIEVADFFTDIRKPLIRSSPVSTFDECPRKFLYQYKLGISPKTYDSGLQTGSFTHTMLESLFLGKDQQTAIDTVKIQASQREQELIEAAGPSGFLGSGQDIATALVKMDEDLHKGIAMALTFWHLKGKALEGYEVLKDPEGVLMVERVLDVKHPEFTQMMRCPCDLVLVKKDTKDVWILDFKTTSLSIAMRLASTKFSPQIKIYRLALQTVLDEWDLGYTVKGSIHAVIQKPTIKYCPKTKDKGGFHEYVARLIKWYKDKDQTDKVAMVLDYNRFSGPLVDQEFRNRMKQYCAAANASPNVQNFYRTGNGACTKYNKVCPFMALCNSDFAMWPDIIRSQYEIKFREDEENAEG